MSDEKNLLDFGEKRKENIEKKRRNFERVFFNNFLGAYTLIDQAGVISPVDFIDISHDGLSFKIPSEKASSHFRKGEEVNLRIYFTRDSYIPVVTNVVWTRNEKGEDGQMYHEYGARFDKTIPTFRAIENFIDFVYSFAEHSSEDKGDSKVFYL